MLTIDAAGVDPGRHQADVIRRPEQSLSSTGGPTSRTFLQHNTVAFVEVMFHYRKKFAYLGKNYSGRDSD
jgi:hypothetical protein